MDLQALEKEKQEKVNELKALYESSEISYDEYEELVNDLLDLDRISGMLDTEEKKIFIEKAFLAIKMGAGLIK